MNVSEEKIREYVETYSEKESELLQKIYRETHLTTVYPQMLSGNHQGKLLGMLARISGAKTILEIGTFTGYSAIAMAEMTDSDVIIHTIEANEEFESRIRQNIKDGGFEDRIILHTGDAAEIIPLLDIEPDFVFIDADKPGYPFYYKTLINKIPKGGIIVADNVLWGGKVAGDTGKDDRDTKAIKKFNEMVDKDRSVWNIILPLRDGLMLIVKK
jgi:predicted O-methyltransferase YrrM